MGNRIKGKTKPKSMRAAKTASMGSKRKVSRMGKNQQANRSGLDATFLPRSRVLKKLQLSLKDFRRLCILKGIYPREPRGRAPSKRKGRVYYHAKDVKALAHEPVLFKFREFGTFMKKVRKAAGRNEKEEARRRHDILKPTYTLHHLVRERYPRFRDALADLDDALSLTYLFAALPSEGRIRTKVTNKAKRLAGAWGAYVAVTGSVTKSFASVKGVYLEAEVPVDLKSGSGGDEGDTGTVRWVVPHSFTQYIPTDVDFRVMLTYFEFYETLLDFVLFKLYADAGVHYPLPVATTAADLTAPDGEATANVGGPGAAPGGGGKASSVLAAELAAFDVALRKAQENAKGGGRSALASVVKDAMADEGEADAASSATVSETKAAKKKRKKLVKSIDDALKGVKDEDDDEDAMDEEAEEEGEKVDITAPLRKALNAVGDEDTPASDPDGNEPTLDSKLSGVAQKRKRLFAGLTFFLSREVPRGYLELVVLSRGGKIGWECTDGSSPLAVDDASITHHVADRPCLPAAYRERLPKNREYVQPQYVLDCANFEFLLPVRRYAAASGEGGKAVALPPHLSPWTDEDGGAEDGGYKPKYAEEVERLKNGEAPLEEEEVVADEGDLVDEDENETEIEVKKVDDSSSSDEDEVEEEEEEEEVDAKETERRAAKKKKEEDEEAHGLARAMMSKKASRLYDRMQHGIAEKQTKVDNLHKKRREIESTREKKDGKSFLKRKVDRLKQERGDIEKVYANPEASGGSMKKGKKARRS